MLKLKILVKRGISFYNRICHKYFVWVEILMDTEVSEESNNKGSKAFAVAFLFLRVKKQTSSSFNIHIKTEFLAVLS